MGNVTRLNGNDLLHKNLLEQCDISNSACKLVEAQGIGVTLLYSLMECLL
jgi:hypothetical protein